MRIDWFTFVAQVFNFLILVALLRRFLYRPVLEAADRREEEIASRLSAAAQEHERARAEADRYQGMQESLEGKRASLIRAAEEEARTRRDELRREARQEVEQAREAWRESLRRQREDFLELVRARMGRQLFEGMKKALGELADADLEARVVEVFLRRLAELPAEEGEPLVRAIRETRAVQVRSAFPIGETDGRKISRLVEEWAAGDGVAIHFDEAPDLGVGIELVAGDRRVGWSASGYLRELEAEAVGLLDAEVE